MATTDSRAELTNSHIEVKELDLRTYLGLADAGNGKL